MTQSWSLAHLPENSLRSKLVAVVERGRRTTASLLACLAEFDRRELWAQEGVNSTFAFCTERTHRRRTCAATGFAFDRAGASAEEIHDDGASGVLERAESVPSTGIERALLATRSRDDERVDVVTIARAASSGATALAEALPNYGHRERGDAHNAEDAARSAYIAESKRRPRIRGEPGARNATAGDAQAEGGIDGAAASEFIER